MSKAIIGVFEDPAQATAAVDALADHGVIASRISVLATEPTAEKGLAVDTETKGAEGTAVGAGIGAVAGGLLAGLTAVGTIATGGAGLLVAGPLVAAMAGAGAGGVTGGVIGGLIGLGFSEEEVEYFENVLDEGSVLIAVDMENADDDETVKGVLKDRGAENVKSA
jgi:hypothetical protein